MRSHGDPNQADPTITPSKLIDITWNPATPGGIYGTNKGGQGNSGPGQFCRADLSAAQTKLQGGASEKLPGQAEFVKFAECMRANGVPDFPDPTGTSINIANLDLNSPIFQHAAKACGNKTGVRLPGIGGTPPPGTIELDGTLPGGGGG